MTVTVALIALIGLRGASVAYSSIRENVWPIVAVHRWFGWRESLFFGRGRGKRAESLCSSKKKSPHSVGPIPEVVTMTELTVVGLKQIIANCEFIGKK